MDYFFYFSIWGFRTAYRLFYHWETYGLNDRSYPGAAIIAPNHASFLDPPLIAATFWPEETHFLARASLFNSWYMKWILEHLHSHPVTGSVHDIKTMRLVCELLKENKKVVIFPEGIRSEDGQLQSVKSGMSMLALRMNCPIIPVYIYGTYEAWPRHSKWPKGGSKIACVFGKPIYSESYAGLNKKQAQEELTKQVQLSIEKLKEWYQAGAKGDVPS